MGTSVDDEHEWDDNPTPNDSKHDTAPHDLSGVARALAAAGDGDSITRTAYAEGQEDVIRALYAVMKAHRLSMAEMDNIVLLWRREITGL
jgi:hypothetical protein